MKDSYLEEKIKGPDSSSLPSIVGSLYSIAWPRVPLGKVLGLAVLLRALLALASLRGCRYFMIEENSVIIPTVAVALVLWLFTSLGCSVCGGLFCTEMIKECCTFAFWFRFLF